MFHFNRKPNSDFMTKLSHRHQEKQAMREQANQQIVDEVFGRMNDNQNIAAYFNQQALHHEGYQMTIRQSDGAGSTELAQPLSITRKTIEQIQQSEGVFLEGHVRTQHGLIKDIYDSAYPNEIMRENCGRKDIITPEDLIHMDEERKAQKIVEQVRRMPKTTVIYKDDTLDIPMMHPERDSGRSL